MILFIFFYSWTALVVLHLLLVGVSRSHSDHIRLDSFRRVIVLSQSPLPTKHNTRKRQTSMPFEEFETAVLASERP